MSIKQPPQKNPDLSSSPKGSTTAQFESGPREHGFADFPNLPDGSGPNSEIESGGVPVLDNGLSSDSAGNIEFLLDIPLEISIELGRSKMLINDLLKLGQSSVIELSKRAGESLEILVNQKLIARGEVVVVNEKYGIRVTEILSPMERIEKLR